MHATVLFICFILLVKLSTACSFVNLQLVQTAKNLTVYVHLLHTFIAGFLYLEHVVVVAPLLSFQAGETKLVKPFS